MDEISEDDLTSAAKLACEVFYGNDWQWKQLGAFQQRWKDVAQAVLLASPTSETSS